MSQKAVFLDRDDTIIEDPGYISSPEQVKLIPGVAQDLVALRKMGYKLIIVSNQSGIARGIITEQAIAQIHERLKQLLAEQNAYLDRIYYCPYHPEGVVQKFRKDSDWRKPKPGMLLAAAKEMKIDLAGSWMIGNTYNDISAGKAAGCRTILIKSHTYTPIRQLDDPDADFEAINLKESVNIVKREMMPKQSNETPEPVVEPQKTLQNEPQPAQQENRTEKKEPETAEQKIQEPVFGASSQKTEQLLEEIKLLLKSRHRDELYSDFSAFKLFAGILQIVVLACLFIALQYRMSPSGADGAVFTALGFAIVFQLMAITLYIMHNDR
jgi:D-glycero-D-manno-heptose 1,7-bisphosphate phosphatase